MDKTKKKTRQELIKQARRWLLDQGYSTKDAKAIANGTDPHCTIDKVTGKIWWNTDIRDRERIQEYKNSKAWIEDPEND